MSIVKRLPTARERTEELERASLSVYATLAAESKGRDRYEEPDELRTPFQQDRDRIIHSKAFRRLKDKTQVFVAPRELLGGDHYRVRLTHTLETAQIGRTIARALRLNEDLVEAVALGHDLGHTPFGHAGEEALSAFTEEPFRHNEQSLRIVEQLERGGRGLNLTWEVRDGILHHPWSTPSPATPEAQVVRMADRIAYLNHDLDDAFRAGILTRSDLPEQVVRVLGSSHGERITTLVSDVVGNSLEEPEVRSVVEHIKENNEPIETVEEESLIESAASTGMTGSLEGESDDPLLEEARKIAIEAKRVSASLLQRRLRIGYARAARFLDMLEEQGIVGAAEGNKPREVLVRSEEKFVEAEEIPGPDIFDKPDEYREEEKW
jgi:dGTPase